MRKTALVIASICIVIAVSLFSTGGASAKTKSEVRPGWGFGDSNHIHVGPSALSDRPGNGYGDDNHFHVGPPGLSDHPGDNGKEFEQEFHQVFVNFSNYLKGYLSFVFHSHHA